MTVETVNIWTCQKRLNKQVTSSETLLCDICENCTQTLELFSTNVCFFGSSRNVMNLVSHESWSKTYNKHILDWFLTHSRSWRTQDQPVNRQTIKQFHSLEHVMNMLVIIYPPSILLHSTTAINGEAQRGHNCLCEQRGGQNPDPLPFIVHSVKACVASVRRLFARRNGRASCESVGR